MTWFVGMNHVGLQLDINIVTCMVSLTRVQGSGLVLWQGSVTLPPSGYEDVRRRDEINSSDMWVLLKSNWCINFFSLWSQISYVLGAPEWNFKKVDYSASTFCLAVYEACAGRSQYGSEKHVEIINLFCFLFKWKDYSNSPSSFF